jgi:hypothetical protein
LAQNPMDKGDSAHEMEEVEVVRQAGKARLEPRGRTREEKTRGGKNRGWPVTPHLPHPNPTNRLYKHDSGVRVSH